MREVCVELLDEVALVTAAPRTEEFGHVLCQRKSRRNFIFNGPDPSRSYGYERSAAQCSYKATNRGKGQQGQQLQQLQLVTWACMTSIIRGILRHVHIIGFTLNDRSATRPDHDNVGDKLTLLVVMKLSSSLSRSPALAGPFRPPLLAGPPRPRGPLMRI